MFAEFFRLGGPVMWLVFAAWVVVLAGALDRAGYWLGAVVRRPVRAARRLAERGEAGAAQDLVFRELQRADYGLGRLDAFSQLATSLGLFGTVLGIARAFFARGGAGGELSPEVLGDSLATALFTTVAGLAVFLVGQTLLALFSELQAVQQRKARAALAARGRMNMATHSRERRQGGLRGLTPLLDTLFLLLFTLLATSESRSSEDLELLRIRLPEVERAAAETESAVPRLVLEVMPDGTFGIAGEPERYSRPAALAPRLAEFLGAALAEETAVEILGDRAAPHGAVVRLLQNLRLRGFVSIDLVATGEPEGAR